MIRWIAGVFLVAILVLAFVAWRRSLPPPTPADAPAASSTPAAPAPEPGPGSSSAPAGSPATPAAPAADLPGGPSGLTWTVPDSWHAGGARAMRLATYVVGGSDPASTGECAVFYFGPGLGGGVDENVNRWLGQFDANANNSRRTFKVHDLPVTRVEIAGTFLAPGVDMRSQGKLASWKLLGAIVEGPKGAVFFKFTGPASVVDRATDDFDALIASIEKH